MNTTLRLPLILVFLLLASCAFGDRMNMESDTLQTRRPPRILGGACSLDPKFQYLFEFEGEQLRCKRWPLGEPEKVIVKQGSATSVREICRKILSEVPEAKPPFEPSSIQVQIKVEGRQNKLFDTHPPQDLFFKLLKMLSELYATKK